ncbi:MAG: FAD:protein FMN transferase [Actinobacteria bacterium]|nr:FAD:protein FMN transferase [Actinomycetota bacterium]
MGTTVRVAVTDARDLEPAEAAVRAVVDELDATCSRFRTDAEVAAISRSGGRPVVVSPMLYDAIAVAVRAARLTGGAVDPTGGARIRALGYDRDFSLLTHDAADTAPGETKEIAAFPGWRLVALDSAAPSVTVPAGLELDLGATAKGWGADVAAAAATKATDGGSVLVSLGGDIAVSGPAPDGGWTIRIAEDSNDDPDSDGPTVTIRAGGVATSSTTVRCWTHAGVARHHILDPRDGHPVVGPWRTVTVAAASCVEANIASTAAIVQGEAAPMFLEGNGLAGRLVHNDGTVTRVGGWPPEDSEGEVK